MNPNASQQSSDGLGPAVSRLFLSTIIPIFGLFFLRLVLASLPMIKHAAPISELNVTPLILIKAALDSVIYFLIIRFVLGCSQHMKLLRPRWIELANIVVLAGCALVATLAYSGYELLCASLAPAQMEIYNWVFLAVVLIPVALIVIIATRHMDLFTEIMFGKLSAAVSVPQPMPGFAAPAAAQPAWNPPAPPPSAPPSVDFAEQQIRGQVASAQKCVVAARQTAENQRARGALNGESAESLGKMEGYLDGAVKSLDRRDWVEAKSFADWAEYEANRIVAANGQ